MELLNKSFEELDVNALYQILKLRVDIFVVEQTCPYPDLDDKDTRSETRHLYLMKDGRAVVYARCMAPGVTFDGCSAIGRIAVAKSERGNEYARSLVLQAIVVCCKQWPDNPVMISAQAYLLDFYKSCGFKPVGEPYEEDGIPHQDMLFHTL